MFSARWSSFSLLLLAAAAGLVGFRAGRSSAERVVAAASRDHAHPAEPLVRTKAPAAVTPDAPAAVPWDDRWSELRQAASAPGRESELVAMLEDLARRDPPRALAFATAESNLRLRAAFLRAVAKGWATTEPEAAADWAESEDVMDRSQAVAAVLQGAVRHPEAAVQVARSLIARTPTQATEYGNDLVSALAESGEFERATAFARTGTGEARDGWLLTAYSRWAEFQPQAAALAALQLGDDATREAAMNAVVVGWAPTNPPQLIEFAERHLEAGEQSAAVARALEFWAGADPVAAAKWISQHNPGPLADPGMAEIARSRQIATFPELALSWAGAISNPMLRTDTFGSILQQWATQDRDRAEAFVRGSPLLAADERPRLLARLRGEASP